MSDERPLTSLSHLKTLDWILVDHQVGLMTGVRDIPREG